MTMSTPTLATPPLSLDAKPVPSTPGPEITELALLLGYSSLSQLLGTSESSLRRYGAGRPAPAQLDRRIHFLAELVYILNGSYNKEGIERWLNRPRSALRDRSPAEVLSVTQGPDETDAYQVWLLAVRLLA